MARGATPAHFNGILSLCSSGSQDEAVEKKRRRFCKTPVSPAASHKRRKKEAAESALLQGNGKCQTKKKVSSSILSLPLSSLFFFQRQQPQKLHPVRCPKAKLQIAAVVVRLHEIDLRDFTLCNFARYVCCVRVMMWCRRKEKKKGGIANSKRAHDSVQLGKKKKRATQQFSLATAFWKCCAVRQNNEAPLRTSRKKGEKKERERIAFIDFLHLTWM